MNKRKNVVLKNQNLNGIEIYQGKNIGGMNCPEFCKVNSDVNFMEKKFCHSKVTIQHFTYFDHY